MKRLSIIVVGAVVPLLLGPVTGPGLLEAGTASVYDPASFEAMKYRSIGPYRGGRVTAVTGVPDQLHTFYMGSTGGGVWKTTDGGETWVNVSDGFFQTASVGAIAVAESDANVVYVGMGSACIRGNTSPGDGVYRSTDAGKTWSHLGLKEAGQIGRIRVHPNNPELVYVAALGHAFGANPERGVFRSADGGSSWQKVLYVSEQAGAVDLAMDPNNPRILYAAVWEVVRKPWTLISGGEGSGLYKSSDGGNTWTELTEGLPQGTKGRIGVTVSGARSERVWALVEAEDGGVYRSDDGGESFKLINDDRNFRQRAWYYTHIYADPVDPETVYVLNVAFYRSSDGGESFDFVRTPHGDNHDLWINPKDPRILLNGNDGGANVSYNRGRSWSTQTNQPTAEFYRVTTDNQFPYRVYGAQQDNSTVSIASRTAGSGITVQDWYDVGGGESGHIAVDPRDPDIVYAGSYGGTITRYDHETGQTREILTYPQLALGRAARDLRYRFQWNAPIRISPHDPSILYHASNVVHRSTDEGQSWEVISPDLTRDDEDKQGYSGGPITWDNTGVEVYGTIFAFEESPHEEGLLWAGSDDGLVHVSRDGGRQWQEITPQQMPEWGQVNMIELSPHAAGRAFLAVTRYKLDDFRPYVFRTGDYGKTWTLLTDGKNGIPQDHFVRVVREDPERRGLLYAGTEFGIYVSFDDGANWRSLQLNLPVTPITDMVVKERDLVVATQGRSFWILDDLTPLHQLSAEVVQTPGYLFFPRQAHRIEGGGGFGFSQPRTGENPPDGAILYYYMPQEPEEEIVLEILDSGGEVVRTFSSQEEERRAPNPYAQFLPEPREPSKLPAKKGLNRFVWDLRLPDAEIGEDTVLWGVARGPIVAPGPYQVRMSMGSWRQSRTLDVRKDPRLAATREELQEQFDLARAVWEKLTEAHGALRQVRAVRTQVQTLVSRLAESGRSDEEIDTLAESLTERLTAVEEAITQPRSQGFQDPLNYPPALDADLLYLLDVVTSAQSPPTGGSYERFAELETTLAQHLAELEDILATDLAAFNTQLREAEVPAVIVP